MAQIHYGRGYVYSIQYHIVWCVKYRHKILNPIIENSLKEILNNIATVSENTEEQIKKYINSQKQK